MADTVSTIDLSVSPLVSVDPIGLQTASVPRVLDPQPAFLVETSLVSLTMPAGITTAADKWAIEFVLPSPMPGYRFFPLIQSGTLQITNLDNDFLTLYEDQAEYSFAAPTPGLAFPSFHQFTLGTVVEVMNAAGTEFMTKDADPQPLKGFPYRLQTTTPATSGDDTMLGVVQFRIDTFGATTAFLVWDGRWLAYGSNVELSAAFHGPSRYWRTG